MQVASGAASDEHAVKQQGQSAWKATKYNLAYLYDPKNSPRPGQVRTRALLRTLRWFSIFVFWRLVRWAKYVAIGSLVAAVSATALGGAITGVGWIAAPPTIAASIISGCVWQVGKYGARKLHKRWEKDGGDAGEDSRQRAQELDDMNSTRAFGEAGPAAVPW